jgi:hypothetical protein
VIRIPLLLAIGCAHPPRDLPGQLARDAEASDRRAAVAGWQLSRATWERVVVPPFRNLYDAYVAEYPAHVGELAAHLAPPFRPRPHFAGDPKLTLDEAVTRWIVPTLFPSQVVDGLDAVFVRDDDRFYALVGMSRVIERKLDLTCRPLLARVGPPGRCGDAVWQFVVDSLRGDTAAAAHTCSLATALCGTRSP